jgi:hypothetical protein
MVVSVGAILERAGRTDGARSAVSAAIVVACTTLPMLAAPGSVAVFTAHRSRPQVAVAGQV